MRKIILGVVISIIITSNCSSQDFYSGIQTVNYNKNIYVGVGLGVGIFNPGDVNDYINTQFEDYYIDEGIEEIVINYNAKFSLNFSVKTNIYLSFFIEGAWAPKWIYGEDEFYFSYTKIAPGFAPKFYFPFASGRHSFFLSPGVTYNKLKFEEYSASNFGGKLQGGVSLRFREVKLQPYGAINIVKANTERNLNKFELNYTDFQIGVEFLF